MFFGPQKAAKALNHCQRETLALAIDRRLEEMIGRLQLPSVISMGFLYVIDAAGRRHVLTMNMAHSYEVCSSVRYDIIITLHLLNFQAI